MNSLSEQILDGDKRALSKAISHIENQTEIGKEIVNDLFSKRNRTPIIGITGPPGSGKSTLISELVRCYKSDGKKIGVLAIDPTSTFSGGAILGDRIRMMDNTSDGDVYVRSMASRGVLGGLSSAAYNTLCIMESFGFDLILLESVGAGQNEIEIHQYCDSVIVVAVPGLGDDIQAIKAGIYEIPDIFLVHKSDLPEAKELKYQIQSILELTPDKSKWRVPVLLVSSKTNQGFEELISVITDHQKYLQGSDLGDKRREGRDLYETKRQIRGLLMNWLNNKIIDETILDLLKSQKISPNEIANKIFEDLRFEND